MRASARTARERASGSTRSGGSQCAAVLTRSVSRSKVARDYDLFVVTEETACTWVDDGGLMRTNARKQIRRSREFTPG